ncbi:hypothetical protein ACFLTN_04570 [Chloroflexota bacterium]
MKKGFTQYALLLLCITLAGVLVACVEKTRPALYPAPAAQWSKTFGDEGDYRGRSVQQTTDGGYIICGDARPYGADNRDIWLIKTDADGNKLWDKTFGGGNNDGSNSVQQTTDGGYIVGGGTFSYGSGGYDIWLIKTDGEGNKLWDKTFGGQGYDNCEAVQQTADGGYIICGTLKLLKSSAMWLIKTDANGNKLWDKTFKIGILPVSGYSVQENSGGGYIVCGELSNNYIWLIKTDAEGNMIWDKTFENCQKPLVQQTKDGGYIICSRDGVATWLIKTDGEGNKLWDKTFTSGKKEKSATSDGDSVKQTSDGGYIICGQRFRPPGVFMRSWDTYIWLAKTDADGNELWNETFPDRGSACGNSVQQTKDGGYIVCGSSGSYVMPGGAILLIKIAPE